jgi:membrane fusion protein (multidrug efflux system)
MAKKFLITAAGLLLVICFLGGTKFAQIATMMAASKGMTQPADTVSTYVAKREQWRPVVTAVGNVTAVQGVTLSNEVAGIVSRVAFESGATVAAGDVLAELDSSTEQAQLHAAEASADLARINLERARDLREKQTIAASELDTAEAQAKQANAQVENLSAFVAKKTLRAPFAGRLGIRTINLGQYLVAGTAIVTLQSLDPIYVDFYLPQQRLASAVTGQDVTVISDADPAHPREGKVTAIAAEVETATRNVKLQATLANTDGMLRPGMFVNVSIFEKDSRDVIVVPATAVLFAAYGNSVFTVEKAKEGDGLVAMQHFVQLGETRGDFVEISKGIDADAQVVTSGAFKLRNGGPVKVDNSNNPAVSFAPKPVDS